MQIFFFTYFQLYTVLVYIINVSNFSLGTQLEKLMESMRSEIASSPPLEGSFAPRRGDYCIAKYVDGEW